MSSFSLCMIVKNEEKVLARCLDSVAGVFDEIIIVDTGSEDSTKDIAYKYTNKVFDYVWENDFSKARNYAFSLCSGDYIYSADADEVMDDENRKKLMVLKENILPEIEIVQMIYINKHEYMTTENIERELRPKLFKRLRQFMWIDPIHESVNLNPVLYDSDIEIIHMPENKHSKRDFSIFEKAVKNNGLSSKLHGMYALELMLSGEKEDFLNAKDYFIVSLNDSKSEEDYIKSCIVLSRLARITDNISDLMKWSMKVIVLKSCSDICYELGLYYEEHEDYEEAEVWYINAINETEPILDYRTNSDFAYERIYNVYCQLAEKCNDDNMKKIYIDESKKYMNKKADKCIE